MKKNLIIAIAFTVVTTILFGVLYPLAVTGLAQLLFPEKANGQLIQQNGRVIGSRIIGQNFTGPGYFHSRPSNAGSGYDPLASGGSNLAPTNKSLIDRVNSSVSDAKAEHPGAPIPIDLVTSSASGLDPDISPAAAQFQISRVAKERHISEANLTALVSAQTHRRQFGFLGEPRLNVLELNLKLDEKWPLPPQSH
jgi:potassium-transporting ATPase KdpC subunit